MMERSTAYFLVLFLLTLTLLFYTTFTEMKTENAATLERISDLRYEINILKYSDCFDQCIIKNPCYSELNSPAYEWNESQWAAFKTCGYFNCEKKCGSEFGEREKEYYL